VRSEAYNVKFRHIRKMIPIFNNVGGESVPASFVICSFSIYSRSPFSKKKHRLSKVE
jgi:hypothetical protein